MEARLWCCFWSRLNVENNGAPAFKHGHDTIHYQGSSLSAFIVTLLIRRCTGFMLMNPE